MQPQIDYNNLWFNMARPPLKPSRYQRSKKLNRHIGERLCRAREADGYAVADFARKLGVSEDVVSDIEAGILEISPIDLLDLATLLNRELGYFFEGYEDDA